jgi:hypothetical protein
VKIDLKKLETSDRTGLNSHWQSLPLEVEVISSEDEDW